MPATAQPKAPPPLAEYRAKRDFAATPEPAPARPRPHRGAIFVVQEHHATRLHYDFRLEAGGVLKSWAVTNQPSLDPAVKRLAVRVEDHPVAYAGFEGTIPEGQYGAGQVSIWDRGTFEPAGDVVEGLAAGKLQFTLHGGKLNGRFSLVRMGGRVAGRGKENWLLIKGRDEFAAADPAAAAKPKAKRAATPAGPVVVTAGDRPPPDEVPLTHPERVLFPEAGVTKGDLAAYYRTVADRLLPVLRDRPITLERLPAGLGGGKQFWQKNTPAGYPAWVPRADFPSEAGKPVRYALVNDLATLLFLVNQGTITFHPWLSRVQTPDRPDFVLFDLDPGPAPFAAVVRVAKQVHAVLDALGRPAAVKTSGKTGLHVLAAWADGDFDAARAWAGELAGRVAAELPDVATTDIRKAKRGGRVYLDVLQNARGHHAVPPYVVRATPGATVSTPLAWGELTDRLDPKRFTVRTLPARLAKQKADPLAVVVGAGR